MCAGVAVLNSKGHLLVGERLKIPGAWQCPQGGVDEGEELLQAAIREAYEEVGLQAGVHMATVEVMSEDAAVRYEAGGWLRDAGFVGQQLHWVLFRCAHARGDSDASAMLNLSGLGGEAPEFSQVRWAPIDEVVAGIWPAKQPLYLALKEWADNHQDRYLAACAAADLSGRWLRDSSLGTNVAAAAMARRHTRDEAEAFAAAPCAVEWQRAAPQPSGEWSGGYRVTAFQEDGETPLKEIVYSPGDTAGTSGGLRRAFWLPEPDAPGGLAHVTLSESALGHEETWRFLREDGRQMVQRRFFTPPGADMVRSEEVFTRVGDAGAAAEAAAALA